MAMVVPTLMNGIQIVTIHNKVATKSDTKFLMPILKPSVSTLVNVIFLFIILFFRLVLFNLVQNRQDLLPEVYDNLTSQIFNFNFKFPNIFTVFLDNMVRL